MLGDQAALAVSVTLAGRAPRGDLRYSLPGCGRAAAQGGSLVHVLGAVLLFQLDWGFQEAGGVALSSGGPSLCHDLSFIPLPLAMTSLSTSPSFFPYKQETFKFYAKQLKESREKPS